MKRLLTIVMSVLPIVLSAQTLVYLERADNLLFDQNILPDARIVIGNEIGRASCRERVLW